MTPRALGIALATALLGAALANCGGGGSAGGLPPPGPPLVKVSIPTMLDPGCTPVRGGATLYKNSEVEPHVAVDPTEPQHLIAAWQQDRFSDGGARALVYAHSYDGGVQWSLAFPPLALGASACGGNGDYDRTSDPWVAFRADGVAFAVAIAFDDGVNSDDNAVIVFNANPVGMMGFAKVLIADGASAFNDKEAIAADPVDPDFLYVTWDRLTADNRGPAMFSRTVDGGATWSTPVEIHDPGVGNQTLNVTPVVAPDGTLYVHFTEILRFPSGTELLGLKVMRSTDHGATFTTPTLIQYIAPNGAFDPNDFSGLREGAGLASMAVGPSGELVIAFQDIGTNPLRDTIYWLRSTNGGDTWPQGGQVGLDNDAQAFTPAVAIGADGTFGVSFFDMRDDDNNDGPLSVTQWLATKQIGSPWVEHRVSEPFDIRLAPKAPNNPFLGDYMGLVATSGTFVPVYVQTNNQGTANRTDVYTRPIGTLAATAVRAVPNDDKPVARPKPDATARHRAYLAVMRTLEGRIPRWPERQAAFEAAARARKDAPAGPGGERGSD